MSLDPAGTREWARAHKAAWEVLPLFEMNEGQRVQVGYELDLYARLPQHVPDPQLREAFEEIWDRLHAIAESLLPESSPDARLEVEPFDLAGRLRPETGFAPEVLLKARLFNVAHYFTPVDEQSKRDVRPIEVRLGELGLRERSW